MRMIAAGIILLTLLGFTGARLNSSRESPAVVENTDRTALPVKTLVLEPITSLTRERQFSGTIVAARRTRLAFERSARLERVLVDDGQQVEKGQLLAVIDQRQLLAQMAELSAGIRQQRAVLDELNSGPRPETIASARADLDALSADVELRKATLERTQNLYERKATSEQSLDEERLAWKAAVARRDAVSKKLDELTAGTRTEQIAAQEAIVAGLEAQLQRLQIDVADSEVKAPFAGTVVKRMADEGDMLTAEQPIVELVETDKLEAHIGVPPALIRTMDRNTYYILSVDGLEVTGRIRDVIAQVDPATRTQTVVLDIDDAHVQNLADGQLARLKFSETQTIEGFRVPLTSLASGSRGLWSIYVLETDPNEPGRQVVRTRTVEVLHTDGDSAVIRGTVYAGDHVVAEGVHRVVPGQAVSDTTTVAEKG